MSEPMHITYLRRDMNSAWEKYEQATDDPTVAPDTLRKLGDEAEVCEAKFHLAYRDLRNWNPPATRDEAERRSRVATCSNCTLAPALRVCDVCQFQQPIPVVFATDFSTTNSVAQPGQSVTTFSQ